MRILFATIPADGHFNPLTGVAMHLKHEGHHDVRWYAGPTYRPRLEELGIATFPYQRATEVTGANLAALFPERGALKGPRLISFDMEKIFVAEVANFFRDICDIRRVFAFDVLICDAAFYAARLVGETTGIPVHVVGVSPLMATSADVPPPFFGLRPARTPVGKIVHRAVRAMLTRTLTPGARRYNEMLAAEGIAPIDPAAWFDSGHQMAVWYFQTGVPGMDYPRRDRPANVVDVGPLLPYGGKPSPPMPHLDRIRAHTGPVVVASQGTVDNDDPGKLIIPTLEGLAGGPCLVVVTTGAKHTRELRERYPGDQFVIEDFIDFGRLFDHADVFVCNGGYGSVMLAMIHGVPVVGAGRREGKNDVNARLAYRGLGIDLRTERPRARRVARAVTRLVEDEQIRRNVTAVQSELATYDPFGIIDSHLAPQPTVGT